jgi:cysteinyl-tRNA synthetase
VSALVLASLSACGGDDDYDYDDYEDEDEESEESFDVGEDDEDEDYPVVAREPLAAPSLAEQRLAEVRHWFYYIDVNLTQDVIDDVVDSTYDMVVIDFITSEFESTDYELADVVAEIQASGNGEGGSKLVIAYVDVGQAEDFRTYWQSGWGVGDPDWIVTSDPDGWAGNYPVAFWDETWRGIWLGQGGMLDQVAAAGFDGIYMDWIEAYSDEDVIAYGDGQGVDSETAMIDFVADISGHLKGQDPAFIVIAQNAAELEVHDDYLLSIDGIAQEQTWFDGMADGQIPEGDCPLPTTDADIDSDDYYDALSPDCQFYFDEVPSSALYVSTAEYLHFLEEAHARGEIIFTVDYALEPGNVATVYRESRARGFVPFAANRALDTYFPPVP